MPVTPELSIITPTFNERENIGALYDALVKALDNITWELVIVDDNSPDGTYQLAREMSQTDPRVRCIRRIGRRGLAGAAIEGFLSTGAPYIALIDADMQHDETKLPLMLEELKKNCDIVVASRFAEGGCHKGLADESRISLSHAAKAMAQRILHADVTDPTSGFFMMRRNVLENIAPQLSKQGFKLLVDILASGPPLQIAEIPYVFRVRRAGTSKLDTAAKFDYAVLLADKTLGRLLPLRFIIFSVIGVFGIGIHLGVLALLHMLTALSFTGAQIVAAFVAMTSNFFLNNAITYRDKRLRGWDIGFGLISFYTVCAAGLAANIGFAALLFSMERNWWVAGLLGALIGVVWNYAATNVLTWKDHQ
ncbi:MAG: glycosyltransferase family 2 protein [Pseudomonadota bacterium]